MRSTMSLAHRSPRIGLTRSASSALAYRVANIVCGAPDRSTLSFSVTYLDASPASAALPALALGVPQAHPALCGFTNRGLAPPWLPTQFASGLGAVDGRLCAHQPQ